MCVSWGQIYWKGCPPPSHPHTQGDKHLCLEQCCGQSPPDGPGAPNVKSEQTLSADVGRSTHFRSWNKKRWGSCWRGAFCVGQYKSNSELSIHFSESSTFRFSSKLADYHFQITSNITTNCLQNIMWSLLIKETFSQALMHIVVEKFLADKEYIELTTC